MLKQRGFSVIELMVVISIIVILISMLLPSLSKVRTGQDQMTCLSRQRPIGQALASYAIANKGAYPSYDRQGSPWHEFADAYGWRDDLPYSGSASRASIGLGHLVEDGHLPETGLGELIHCPSLNNLNSPVAPGHCMDVASTWGFGGSGWVDNPNHRIIGGFNYRGTSYERTKGTPPRPATADSTFVLLIDTPDLRFRGNKSELADTT